MSPKNEIKESVNDEIDVFHPARIKTAPALIVGCGGQVGVDHL